MNLLNINKKRNKKGFTFVEILIAIFIIGVGVLPVLTIFLTGTRTIESGGVIFQVAVAAQNIMDTTRSDSFIWEVIPVDIDLPNSDKNKERGLFLPEELVTKYKAKANVKIDVAKGHTVLDSGEPEENLYQIDVVINWEENGVKKNYNLRNYRANFNTQAMKTSTRFD